MSRTLAVAEEVVATVGVAGMEAATAVAGVGWVVAVVISEAAEGGWEGAVSAAAPGWAAVGREWVVVARPEWEGVAVHHGWGAAVPAWEGVHNSAAVEAVCPVGVALAVAMPAARTSVAVAARPAVGSEAACRVEVALAVATPVVQLSGAVAVLPAEG